MTRFLTSLEIGCVIAMGASALASIYFSLKMWENRKPLGWWLLWQLRYRDKLTPMGLVALRRYIYCLACFAICTAALWTTVFLLRHQNRLEQDLRRQWFKQSVTQDDATQK